jgi:hypothetical protein
MTETAECWLRARDEYHYPVQLSTFAEKDQFPGWFDFDLNAGSIGQTTAFEDRFRNEAANHVEPWFEVVFWKLYNTPVWSNKHTCIVISNLRRDGITASDLWNACSNYVSDSTKESFKKFQCLLWGAKSTAVAVAATFPAFIAPDRFPMVDTRVAKWVIANMDKYNVGSDGVPKLQRPAFTDKGATVLTFSDWAFIESWTHWSRAIATRLAEDTGITWRARDVEMAVFNAWGSKGEQHPKINLPVL